MSQQQIKLTPSQLQDPNIIKALKFRNVLSHYLSPFMKGDYIDTPLEEIRKSLRDATVQDSGRMGFNPYDHGRPLVVTITTKDNKRAHVGVSGLYMYEWLHLNRPLGSIAEEIRHEFLRFLFKETIDKYRDVDVTVKL